MYGCRNGYVHLFVIPRIQIERPTTPCNIIFLYILTNQGQKMTILLWCIDLKECNDLKFNVHVCCSSLQHHKCIRLTMIHEQISLTHSNFSSYLHQSMQIIELQTYSCLVAVQLWDVFDHIHKIWMIKSKNR